MGSTHRLLLGWCWCTPRLCFRRGSRPLWVSILVLTHVGAVRVHHIMAGTSPIHAPPAPAEQPKRTERQLTEPPPLPSNAVATFRCCLPMLCYVPLTRLVAEEPKRYASLVAHLAEQWRRDKAEHGVAAAAEATLPFVSLAKT